MKNLKITMLLAMSLAAAVPAIPVYASSNTVTAYSSRQRSSNRSMEAAAKAVKKAFEKKDLNALADISTFPLAIIFGDGDLVTLDNRKALTDLDSGRIFTKELCEAIAATDLAKLDVIGDSGLMMGSDNGLNLFKIKGKWKVNSIYTGTKTGDSTTNITDLNEAALVIQKCFYSKDLETLSQFCNYPLTITKTDGKLLEVKDAKALIALGENKVFTDKLSEAIYNADKPKLSSVGAEGASLGDAAGLTMYSVNGVWRISDIYQ